MTALLTDVQVEAEYGIPVNTLRHWRQRWAVDHNGPRWIKLTDSPRGPVRYRRADVDAWLTERAA